MNSRWRDFLFTIAVRSVSGGAIGMIISVPFIFFGRRKSPLVELIQAERYGILLGWFGLWALGGAVIAVWTIPHWQRPWFKYRPWEEDDGKGG